MITYILNIIDDSNCLTADTQHFQPNRFPISHSIEKRILINKYSYKNMKLSYLIKFCLGVAS
jgi:hypothetical protein